MDCEFYAKNLAAALFRRPECWPEVAAVTNSEECPDGPCKKIMRLLEGMTRDGKEPELENLAARMDKELRAEIVACNDVLVSDSLENVLFYARKIHDAYTVSWLSPKLMQSGYDLFAPEADVPAILTELRSSLDKAIESMAGGDSVEKLSAGLLNFLSEIQKPKSRYSGTGYGDLDFFIGGYAPGDFDAIAARSGGGKSDLAVTLAVKLAQSGVNVLYESLEMYTLELVERIMSDKANVPSVRLRDHKQTPQDYDNIAQATDKLYNLPLWIDERSRLTVAEMEAVIGKYRPQVVFIDNLDLLKSSTPSKDKWRENEENCHALKALAKRTNTCVVALVQLNRTADAYKVGVAPKMSDLYGGSAIEHDASWVIALTATEAKGRIKAHVLKSRAGTSGGSALFDVNFNFHRWIEVDGRYDDE